MVRINGGSVEALLDTGSQVSLIAASAFERLRGDKEVQQLQTPFRITAANGLEVPYSGYFEADIEVEGQLLERRAFLVMDDAGREDVEPLLLGMNILRDVKSSLFSFPKVASRVRFARVVHKADVCVPPLSGATVRVAGGGGHAPGTPLLFEPLSKSPLSGVLFPSTRVQAEGSHLTLPVINLSHEAVVLHAGLRLGTFETVARSWSPEIDVELQVNCERIHVSCTKSPAPDPISHSAAPPPVDVNLPHLSPAQQESLAQLVLKNRDRFRAPGEELGSMKEGCHTVPLEDDVPVASHFRRLPPTQYHEVKEHIQELLEQGIIQRSHSPYASPVVVCRKKDGSIRLTVDYRKLNAKTKRDAYPLPRIDDSLDALGGSRFFSTLDLSSGYYQVELDPNDRERQPS